MECRLVRNLRSCKRVERAPSQSELTTSRREIGVRGEVRGDDLRVVQNVLGAPIQESLGGELLVETPEDAREIDPHVSAKPSNT